MEDINLIDRTMAWMSRKQYRSKSRGTFWPSEASAKFLNDFNEVETVGKCHRAIYYRIAGVKPTNPPSPKSEVIFLLGNLIEDQLVEMWKQMGIWENNSVRWEDKARNLSGEFDVILREGNRKYGAECITPDSLIPLYDGRIFPAKAIEPGSTLIDYDGQPVVVKNVQIKEVVDQKLFRYKSKINGLLAEFSSEHPIWTGDLKISRKISDNKVRSYSIINQKFTKAEDVKPGMYISTPYEAAAVNGIRKFNIEDFLNAHSKLHNFKTIIKDNKVGLSYAKNINRQNFLPRVIDLNDDIMYLFGLYIAEGWASREGAISFSFNTDEKDYITSVKTIMKKYFDLDASEKVGDDGSCTSVIVYCKSLAIIFKTLFGEDAHEKRIPFKPSELDKDQIKSLVKGLINGDGHEVTKTQRRLYTVSPVLAKDTFKLLLSIGEYPSIKQYQQGETTFKGCGYIYRVEFADGDSEIHVIDNDKAFFKVKEVEEYFYSGTFINYEVTGSNTFVAGMIGTHNCKSFYGYHANKQILGRWEGRGDNKRYVYGRPKDEHLMQAAIYADQTQGELEGFKLFYCSRDENQFAEFNIRTDANKRIFINGRHENRFTVNDIYGRYRQLQEAIDAQTIPDKDYTWKPDDATVQRLFERGEISKTAFESHESGKERYTDFHCNYCDYKDYCHGPNSNVIAIEDNQAIVRPETLDFMHGGL